MYNLHVSILALVNLKSCPPRHTLFQTGKRWKNLKKTRRGRWGDVSRELQKEKKIPGEERGASALGGARPPKKGHVCLYSKPKRGHIPEMPL